MKSDYEKLVEFYPWIANLTDQEAKQMYYADEGFAGETVFFGETVLKHRNLL